MRRATILLTLALGAAACDGAPEGSLETRSHHGDVERFVPPTVGCEDATIHYVMTCTYDGEANGKHWAACPEPVSVVPDADFTQGDYVTVVYATCDTPGLEAAVQMAIAPFANYHAPDFF
jgi:hypothetical protein